jgi:hypothetical protein
MPGPHERRDAVLVGVAILAMFGFAVLVLWLWWDVFILETIGPQEVRPRGR